MVPTATVVAEVVPAESVVNDIVTVGDTLPVTVASVAGLLEKVNKWATFASQSINRFADQIRHRDKQAKP